MSSTTVSSPTVSNSAVPTIASSTPTVSTPTVSTTTISAPIIPAPNVTTTTTIAASTVPTLTTSSRPLASLEELSLAQFRLNNKGFSSFEEIFRYIGQQPQEDQWALTQSLLRFRSSVFHKFVHLDAKLLRLIEEQKAWQFVGVDKHTLKVHLGPLRTAVKSAERGATREMGDRMKILSGWGPEVSTIFKTSTRNELKQIVKVVKKYPTYKDARDRINNLIIKRLSDKNSKPTPQKILTRTGDWVQIGEAELSEDPIPYKVLEQLNIRLGPHGVLESGPPPLPSTVTQTTKQITGPENSPLKLTSTTLEKENQNSRAPDFSVPPLFHSLTSRSKQNPKGEKRKKDKHEEESEESSSSDDTSSKKDEPALKKLKVGEEGRPDNKNRGGDGEETEYETPYKRSCWCGEEIPVSVLKSLEQKGDITMVEAIYTWGLMWQRLGWNFCPQHLSKIADHLNLVEVAEVERLDRVKAIWKNRDPQALYHLVMNNLHWFESTEKVWLYGDKKGLDMDPTEVLL